MATLNGVMRVWDVETDAQLGSLTPFFVLDFSSVVNQTGPVAYTVPFGISEGATYIVQATGNPNTVGAFHAYMLEFSLDGGESWDVRTMVLSPVRADVLSETGLSLFQGYTFQGIDRATFHNVTLADALYGAQGTIVPQVISPFPGEFGAGIPLQYVQGILRGIPGLDSWAGRSKLAYIPVIDPAIADILLDGDVNADLEDTALSAFLNQIAGVALPDDTAPYGTRGTWVEDSSDAALNLTGITQGIAIGHVGMSPVGTFRQTVTGSSDAQIIETPGNYVQLQAHLDEVISVYSPQGGSTNHGLPESAKISDPICIRTNHGRDATGWDNSLCVFCADDGAGSGGVYYWAHDGMAYPVGQPLPGANSLQHLPNAELLYVATLTGVYTHSSDVTDTTSWTRVGGLASTVKRIVVDATQSSSTEPVIIAEVSGSGSGGDGLYIYPGLDDSGTDAGYYGWSSMMVGSVSTWSYHWLADELDIVDPNDPAVVLCIFGASGGLSVPVTSRFVTPSGSSITGLYPLSRAGEGWLDTAHTVEAGTVVLSASGALGLYLMHPNGVFTNLNADFSMVDDTGNPPTVNRVFYFGGTIVLDGVDQFVSLIACTDSGPYLSANPWGGSWKAMGKQSGVANVNFQSIAVGQPQTIVDRVVTRLYGATDQGLYVSHSGSRYWDNETTDALTIGAYLTALAGQIGAGPYLDNSITSIGDIGAGGSTGTTGTNLPGPLPTGYTLSGDLVWVRALSGTNKWVYRLVHTTTASPYNTWQFGEISEITTDAATPAATASGRLAKEMVRFMAVHSVPQITVTLESAFADTGHFLRTLRASHLVNVDYDTSGNWGIQLGGPMWVLSHRIYKDFNDSVCRTETVLGTQYRAQMLTPDQIGAGTAYGLSRLQRFGR